MNKPDLQQIHSIALSRWNCCSTSIYEDRMRALTCRRFVTIPGAQWEGNFQQYFVNKPRLEVNKIANAIERVFTNYKSNNLTVKFIPKDRHSQTMSDVCAGLFRSDMQDSCAEDAFDNAFRDAVTGGIGAWRLIAQEEDDSDYQRIMFEPIKDADNAVFFDLNAKRQDKSDARFCFVMIPMTNEEYKIQYPDTSPSSVPKNIDRTQFDWYRPDLTYIAEYYVKERITDWLVTYTLPNGETEEILLSVLDPELSRYYDAIGAVSKRKKKKRTVIHKYIINGTMVLEDCGIIAGQNIPVVPVYGKVSYVEGVERIKGMTQDAMDSQRLKNMQVSSLAELAALSGRRVPIITQEQIAGHQQMWSEQNIKNYPYLPINSVVDANGSPVPMGPLSYLEPPPVPQPMAALISLSEEDMKDMLGRDNGIERPTPNMSGIALEILNNTVESQYYIYIANFAKAMKRCGEIWLSMAKDVYVESGRLMETLTPDLQRSYVEIMRPIEVDGQIEYENDLSDKDFKISVDVGPASSSARAAVVRNVINMATVAPDPDTKNVLLSYALTNMEGEGMEELREYFRKRLVSMGVTKPNEEEQQELQQPKVPTAEEQYLESLALNERAKAQKAEADTAKSIAQTAESEAKTIELLSKLEQDEVKGLLEILAKIDIIKKGQLGTPNQVTEELRTTVKT